MSKEIKKEAQDAELSLEDLTKIAGGTNSNTVDWETLPSCRTLAPSAMQPSLHEKRL